MLTLFASKRDVVGKSVASLRREGFVPAVIYGKGVEATNLSLPEKEFLKVYREAGENTLVELVFPNLEGKEERKQVLIHDVLEDSLSRGVLHVDMLAVALDEVIQTMVPVEFVDEAPVEKNLGGVIIKVASEIEVEALPQYLPHEISISLASLIDFESKIHAKDVVLSPQVTLISDPEMVLVSVSQPLSEEDIKKMEEEGAMGVDSVKVETEEKRAERAEEAASATEE